jgi:rod shape-determining protein MreD
MAFDRPKELLKPIKPRWIVLSFVLAIAVELLPLDATLANWLPDFTAMLALYWTLNQPRRFGIGWSFGIGLIADVASASVFGQHALAYSVISYLLLSRQRQVVMYNLGQQTLVVLGGLLASQLVMAVSRMLVGGPWAGGEYFIGPFIGAALWPLLTKALLLPQRRGAAAG